MIDDPQEILNQAEKEVIEEKFREAVEEKKLQIVKKKSLRVLLFPWRLKIERIENDPIDQSAVLDGYLKKIRKMGYDVHVRNK